MQTQIKNKFSEFNQTRKVADFSSACFAPSLSLNFEQNGNITACCFNRTYILGKYPDDTIADIWNGEKIEFLRSKLAEYDFLHGCSQCLKMIDAKNYDSVLIKHFDDFHKYINASSRWKIFSKIPLLNSKSKKNETLTPSVFEFELSNICNLECIMCGGNWSSSIRKNRENLPPIYSPYDQNFVEQIKPFLKDLKRVNFLGGEPFLIKIYLELWEAIAIINPNIEVAITSNGTVLNERIKDIVNNLNNCKITLSIDSLQKETWESIRRNGDFETLQKNINWFEKMGKLVSFSVCPMIQNWKEIPDIIAYCQKNNLDIYFNIVYGPLGGKIDGIHNFGQTTSSKLVPETSLQYLSKNELQGVIDFYKSHSFSGRQGVQFKNLINQLDFWNQHS